MALDNAGDDPRSEQQPFLHHSNDSDFETRCLKACFVPQDCLTEYCVEGVDYLSRSENGISFFLYLDAHLQWGALQ